MKRLLAAAAVLFVACGGTGSTTPSDAPSTTPSAAASMTPSDAASMTPGEIRFGATDPGKDCDHSPWATTFPPGSDIFWWAHFRHALPGGSTIVVEESVNGEVLPDLLNTKTLTIPSGGADCMTQRDPVSGIIHGTLKVRLLSGGTGEAEGSATIQ